MFHMMRNTASRGTPVEQAAANAVRQRLPTGWSAEFRRVSRGGRVLAIQAPDGRRAELDVASRKNLSPRDVPNLIRQAASAAARLLVIAPFVSSRSRELLLQSGASYVDPTGNLRIVLNDPAVFLEGRGDDRAPDRKPRALRSLKGAAAGRVVRALCDFKPPFGVRTLAETSTTPLGTVSRVVSLLEDEALVTRDARKQIAAVDWPALITRWARDYNVRTSNRLLSCLEPRGLSALAPKLAKLERYAITGSMAATSIAPARLAIIYVDDAAAAAQTLELVETDAGTNVWLLEPYDDVVFDRTRSLQIAEPGAPIIVAAAPSQVAADLLTSPGRGPQEAAALIDKMKGTEDAWRRPLRS